MDNRRRPRIPDAEWESRKETIHHLYMEQDRRLEGSDGVMNIMETTHGFSASKAQYETRLKRWKFRKYAKKDDWLALSHVLGSRKREGKDTDVLFHGELVHPDRVRKETRRHRRQSNYLYSQFQELPIYMKIRTPRPQNAALRREGRLTLSPRYSPYPLPATRVGSVFGTPSAIVAATEECAMNAFHDLDFFDLPRISNTSWNMLPNNEPFHEQSTRLSLLEVENNNDLVNFQGRVGTSNSHIAHDSSTSMDPTFALNPMPGLVARNAYTLPNFQTSMEQLFQRMLPGVGSFIRSLHIPDSVLSEFSVKQLCFSSNSQLQHTRGIHMHMLHLVFSRLVNNETTLYYRDDSEPAVNKIYQAGVDYICSLNSHLLSGILDMTPYPYGTALHIGLLRAAADPQAVGTVEVILERHFNPAIDVDLGEVDGWASFPLLVHPKILRVLLKHGVDPEFIVRTLLEHWTERPYYENGATPTILTQWKQPADFLQQTLLANCEIFEQLLQNGTSLGDFRMDRVLFCGPAELISVVLNYCPDQFEKIFISNRGLVSMINRRDWDHRLISVLRTILEFNAPSTSSDVWEDILAASLSIAIRNERTEVISLLLAAGALPNSNCLVNAVITKNIRLFQQCLDLGADPNTQYGFHPNEPPNYPLDPPKGTALSECIRQGNKEAIHMLTEKGHLEKLRNNELGFELALTAACGVGDESLVHHLLSLKNEYGRERNNWSQSHHWREINGEKSMVAAVESGSEAIICQLLTAEFAPGYEALLKAVQERHSSIVELLIGVVRLDPLEYSWTNMEILFEATRWRNINVIRALIQVGIPLDSQVFFNLRDERDWILPEKLRDLSKNIRWSGTALSMAILTGNSEAMELLLKSGAHLNTHISDPGANRYGHDLYPDSDVWLMTPLTACVVRDDLKKIQELLYRGADPFDNSAIYIASVLQQENTLNVLLDAFAQRYPYGVRGFGSDALFHAIISGNNQMFELLVKSTDAHKIIRASTHYGTSSFGNYISPFGEAIWQHHEHSGHCNALQVLLQRQEDTNSVVYIDHVSLTALHFAIELESLDTTKLLVNAGANISYPLFDGTQITPLQAAARNGCIQIVQYLLQQGADPNEAPGACRGATALQHAAIHGSIELANLLLDKHAKVNADPAIFNGRTAFEGAAEHGRIEMMLVLFQRGADLLANDRRQYQRAVQFATRNCQVAAKRFADELLETAIQNEQSRQFLVGDVGLTALDMDLFDEFPLLG